MEREKKYLLMREELDKNNHYISKYNDIIKENNVRMILSPSIMIIWAISFGVPGLLFYVYPSVNDPVLYLLISMSLMLLLITLESDFLKSGIFLPNLERRIRQLIMKKNKAYCIDVLNANAKRNEAKRKGLKLMESNLLLSKEIEALLNSKNKMDVGKIEGYAIELSKSGEIEYSINKVINFLRILPHKERVKLLEINRKVLKNKQNMN